MDYSALFRSALVALLRNKMRSMLTVMGITIGIAAVICVVAVSVLSQFAITKAVTGSKSAAPEAAISWFNRLASR